MTDKVLTYIQKEDLLEKGDRVLLGVSGGADSVCLFFVFLDLAERMELTLSVIYVEHGIRGEESLSDGRFVEELCSRFHIPFVIRSVDAPAYATENHLSLEEAARMLRYGAFSEEAKRLGAEKIATAHNANDNAETVLFRMIRGTGVKGLCGILPKREMEHLTIIRPLLAVTRKEIEEYLSLRGEGYVTDSTNASDDYARNKLRHQVIPALEEINAGAIPHINAAAEKLRKMKEASGDFGEEGQALESGDHTKLSLSRLRQMSEADRREHILDWLRENDAAHNVTEAHIEMLSYIAAKGVGKEYHLPYGFYAKNDYEHLCLFRKEDEGEAYDDTEIFIPAMEDGESISIAMGSGSLRMFVCKKEEVLDALEDGAKDCKNPQKNYAKYFDYDKMERNLVLRHRRQGDFMVIHPDGRTKKLKDYFIEEKILKDRRDALWLLCEGAKVLYVLGYRTGEDLRVKETTKLVLVVEYWREMYE